MASSNIKLFDENKGNMLSDSEFSISNQRLNGLQTGVASSQLQNKAMYQASLVAYAIAQVMMQNGKNANDTDAVSAFVANLSGTMLQKVYDLATTAEAQAGVATGKWMSPALVKAAIDTLAAKAQNILSDYTRTLYNLASYSEPDLAFQKIYSMLKDPPTTYDLPKASGIESDGGAYYFKTIDGVVHVYGSLCSAIGKSINKGAAVATLPAGFRPASRRVFAANLTTDAGGTGTQPPSFLVVESNGNISPGNYVNAVSSKSRAYIYMSFSFVAGA